MSRDQSQYEFFQYLASKPNGDLGSIRVPPLQVLSQTLRVSVARLREQLEVARALGLVEVHPRTGIQRLPYSFSPAVRMSVDYAIEIDRSHFDTFSDLRNHLEAAYWYEAVSKLTSQDYQELRSLVEQAWKKLRSPQIQIPHSEHRQLHMCIFRKLENPFVQGILEAYWEAYESIGLNLYAGYEYLENVWEYHQRMVDAVCSGDFEAGYQALVEHKDLLYHRPVGRLATSGNSSVAIATEE